MGGNSVFVLAHVVSFNHQGTIVRCLESLLAQKGCLSGELSVVLTDNASSDGTADAAAAHFGGRLSVRRNTANMGFCAAHNAVISEGLAAGADYIFVFNPDCVLAPDALQHLVGALESDDRAGSACPKLLRADAALEPVEPPLLDSAGMYITPAIRHFDRGSQEVDRGQYDRSEYVFGGSGAALLLKRAFIEDAALPPLSPQAPLRLFDPAFFAYREDADLAWRGQLLGWRCRYEPRAKGYHVRRVLPENRQALPSELNAYSVRNRFLLQLNNFSWGANAHCLPAASLRNLLVAGAVCMSERSSFAALRTAWTLAPYAARNRRQLLKRARIPGSSIAPWFSFLPRALPALSDTPPQSALGSLTAVVVNYNSGQRLGDCLKALLVAMKRLDPDIRKSVCVVDNNSSDASAERLKPLLHSSLLCHLESPGENLGFAGAINYAVSRYPADAVLILNPDVYLRENTLELLLAAFNRWGELGAAAPVLVSPDGKPQVGFTARSLPFPAAVLAEAYGLHRLLPGNRWTMRYLMLDDPLIVECLTGEPAPEGGPRESRKLPLPAPQPAGACLMVRGEAFEAVGGFDSRFYPAWFEDVDFCSRLSGAGYRLGIVPGASAVHEGGYSLESLPPGKFAEMWYRNMSRYWRKHGTVFDRLTLALLLPPAILMRCAGSLGSAWLRCASGTAERAAALGNSAALARAAWEMFSTVVHPARGSGCNPESGGVSTQPRKEPSTDAG